MTDLDGTPKAEGWLRRLEAELDDFETLFRDPEAEVWDYEEVWYRYVVEKIPRCEELYPGLDGGQQQRFQSIVTRLRALKPLIEENGFAFPKIVDRLEFS